MPATISCIAVLAPDAADPSKHLIGGDGNMPWHFPADLRWFRRQTLGKPVLMGRKTFASIGGKPLPGRDNLVVGRTPDTDRPEDRLHFFTDLQAAVECGLRMAGAQQQRELMVIGGGQIYAQLLDRSSLLYITWVGRAYRGDTYFPPFDPERWHLEDSQETSDQGVALRFCRYRRAG